MITAFILSKMIFFLKYYSILRLFLKRKARAGETEKSSFYEELGKMIGFPTNNLGQDNYYVSVILYF